MSETTTHPGSDHPDRVALRNKHLDAMRTWAVGGAHDDSDPMALAWRLLDEQARSDLGDGPAAGLADTVINLLGEITLLSADLEEAYSRNPTGITFIPRHSGPD